MNNDNLNNLGNPSNNGTPNNMGNMGVGISLTNNNGSSNVETLNNNSVNQVETLNTIDNIETLDSPSVNTQTYVNPLPNNNIYNSQVDNINEDELLKAFIGNNYDKIVKGSFNIPGFFFTTLYMFYRKMFGYALLAFLGSLIILNVLKMFPIAIVFNILIGLFVNKIYVSYAKKRVSRLHQANPNKSLEELKSICASKGGVSVGNIFIGFLVELVISVAVIFVMILIGFGSMFTKLLDFDNWNIEINNNKGNYESVVLEDASLGGYSCIGTSCTMQIEDSNGNLVEYDFNNDDLFIKLSDYEDYVKVNIYYTESNDNRSIVDYKIFNKSTGEDISSVSDESELREKLGLYSLGEHTEILTLKSIGANGVGMDQNESYAYTEYVFTDNNTEYNMKYISKNGILLTLTEGTKYNVTFIVQEGLDGYEYIIDSIS